MTEWALPGLSCACCGTVTFADPPAGARQGPVSYGPVLNAAAVLLSCYGNVPPERAAQVIAMLLGVPVSAGFADKAAARVSAQLGKAGFGEAMHNKTSTTELVYRHELRPVITTGAEVMDRILSRGNP